LQQAVPASESDSRGASTQVGNKNHHAVEEQDRTTHTGKKRIRRASILLIAAFAMRPSTAHSTSKHDKLTADIIAKLLLSQR
jgi:hypothetical protein